MDYMQTSKIDPKAVGIRLGRAIDRWPGGGQMRFAAALAEHADRHGLTFPRSYRTLVNYLQGRAKKGPNRAWLDAAAELLGVTSEWLLTGAEDRHAEASREGAVQYTVNGSLKARERTSALIDLILNQYHDLPMEGRQIIFDFVEAYYEGDFDGWDQVFHPGNERARQVDSAVREHFGAALGKPTADDLRLMSTVCALAAAAYSKLSLDRLPHR